MKSLYERLRAGEFNTPKDEEKTLYDRIRAGEFNTPAVPETPDQTIAEPATIAPEPPPTIDPFAGGYMPASFVPVKPDPEALKEGIRDVVQRANQIETTKPDWLDTISNALFTGAAQFNRGVLSLLKAPPDLVDLAASKIAGKEVKNPVTRYLESLLQREESTIGAIQNQMAQATGAQDFAYTGLSNLTNMLATMYMGAGLAGTAAQSGAGTIKQVSPAVQEILRTTPFGAQAAGGYMRDAELEGAGFADRLAYGIMGGLVETITEAPVMTGWVDLLQNAGGQALLKSGANTLIKKFGQAGLKWLTNVAGETAQEVVVEPLMNIAKKATYDPSQRIIEPKQMAEAAYGGFAMSVMLGALGLPVSAASRKMAERAIREGKEITPELVNEIQKQFEQDTKTLTQSGKGTLRPKQQEAAPPPPVEQAKPSQAPADLPATPPTGLPVPDQASKLGAGGEFPAGQEQTPAKADKKPPTDEHVGQTGDRVQGAKIRYTTGGDVLGDEYHGWIAAVDENNQVLGSIDYSYYNNEYGIKMIEVAPEFRRKGIATGLLEQLRKEAGGKPIKVQGDFATEEGAAWLKAVGYDETRDLSRQAPPEPTQKPAQDKTEKHTPPERLSYYTLMMENYKKLKDAKPGTLFYNRGGEKWYFRAIDPRTGKARFYHEEGLYDQEGKRTETIMSFRDIDARGVDVDLFTPEEYEVIKQAKEIWDNTSAERRREILKTLGYDEPLIKRYTVSTIGGFDQNTLLYLSNYLVNTKEKPDGQKSLKGEGAKTPKKPVNAATVKALRYQAKTLDRQIEEKRNPAIAQQNRTVRRDRIVAGMAAEADRLERLQTTINRIADAMEDGSLAPVLSQIKKKTQVETLLAVSRREKPSIFWVHPETLKRSLEEAKGMNGIADIRPLVERVIRNGGRSNSEKEVKAISRLVNILNNAGKLDYAVKTLKESVTEANRLLEMGIVDSDSLREAIKAIEPYVEGKPKEKTKEQLIREKESALIETKIPGYFPTPRTLAQNLVYRADIKPGMKVLEPSAGKGNIADQVPKEADLSVIEINSTLRDLLETKGYNVVDRDFLEHTGEYDRIVMNPPFEKGQDIDHVRHAYDLLKPGGKLVAIMSEGPFFRNDKKATEFREWFEEVGGTSEKLPAGSFTGPEAERQTGVNARLVEIEKREVSPDKSQSSSLASEDKPKEIFQAFPPVKEMQVNIEDGELSIPEEWIDSVTTNADHDSGISYTELRKDLSSEVKNALARIKSPEITTEIHRWDGETVQVKGEAVTPGMVIEKDEDGKFVLWHINSGKYIAKYRNRESAILCAKVLSQYGDLSALDEAGIVQLVRENKLQKYLNQVALRDANNQFLPYDGMELVLGYKTAEKIYKNMVVGGEKVYPYNKETAEAILQAKPKVSSILDLVTKKVWRTPNNTFINDKNSPVGHLVGSELLLFLNDEFKISDKKLTETATGQAKRKKRVIDDAGHDAMIKEWFETPTSAEKLSDPKWIDKDFVIFEVERASEKEKYISISVPVYDYLTREGYEFYYNTQGYEIIKIAKGDKVVGVVGPARVEKDAINENYAESLPPPPKKEDYLTVARVKQTEPARPAEAKPREQPRPVEGETKKSAEEELAERTNQYLKTSGPPLKIVSYQVPVGKNEARYQDPKLEEAFIAGHGVPQKPILLSIQEYFVELKNKLTRDLEHLPNEPRFEEARTALHRLLKQVGVSNTRAKYIVRGILYRLDRKQLGLYERAVVIYDIAEELKRDNPSVPAVFTKEKVKKELEHINRLVDNDPIVKEALALRKKEMKALVEEYVQAMKSIGLNVEDRFTRENYFHHQVLEYANLHGVFNRKKVKTPSGSGFLKQREGYKGLYNTNYLQVEAQIISEMLHAIEIARTIQKIDQHYNIAEQLKRKAFQINEENTMEYFREMIRQSGDYDPKTLEEDAGKLFRGTLNWKQADAINRLSALAARGELPLGKNGEFEDIVSELAVMGDYAKGEDVDPEGINFKRLFAYANYLIKTDQETGKAEAAQLFRGIREKRKAMEEILGKEFVTWENIIPEGYTKWQPREGSLMFLTESIPAQLAEQLRQGIVESLEISSDDLKTIRAIGGEREWYVIPEEIALTLDNLQRPAPKSWFYKGVKAITKAWKKFRVGNPKTNVKFQFRNLSSDAEWTALGNPRAFKRLPSVMKELYNVFVKDYAPTGELKEFFMRGGFEAGELGQEIGNIDQLKMFKHLVEKKGTVAEAPLKVWQTYWKIVNVSNNFREAVLRYANYLEYLDQMKKNNGEPLNWGASDKKTVMALSDIRDRAFLMSNQLIGAYDRVSVITQEVSDTGLPFFRFPDANFKRYSQWIKNQARDGRAATAVGKHFLGKLAKSPRLAYNVGKLILKAIGLTSILAAWNHLFFPDEEEDLPADVRSSPHIIFGRDKDGNVLYIARLGALEDFIEWFGVDEPYGLVQDFLNGRKTLKDIALDMAKGPVNKLTQALNPLFKVPAEIATGYTIFPDVFEPRRIRDKWLYLAQQLELEEEYLALAKLPRREGYLASWKRALFSVAAPGESAYWEIIDLKHAFLKEKSGGSTYTITDTKRSHALYNMKLALRYNDQEAYKHYMVEYINAGGTRAGINRALASLDPLYGLGKYEGEFRKSLTKEEQAKLRKAIEYYRSILR